MAPSTDTPESSRSVRAPSQASTSVVTAFVILARCTEAADALVSGIPTATVATVAIATPPTTAAPRSPTVPSTSSKRQGGRSRRSERLGITRRQISQWGGIRSGAAILWRRPGHRLDSAASGRLPDERLLIPHEDQQTANVLAQIAERMDIDVSRSRVLPTGEVDFRRRPSCSSAAW